MKFRPVDILSNPFRLLAWMMLATVRGFAYFAATVVRFCFYRHY